jgi:RNA polymerase sigma factor (sigma-70 family)
MKRVSATSNAEDLQHLLLERARNLRHAIAQKIPARFKSSITVEDVLQEVWISAFRTFPDYRPGEPGEFDAWLRVIVNRRLADMMRSAGALKRRATGNGSPGGSGPPVSFSGIFAQLFANEKTPSGEISEQEAADAVRVAMGALPEPCRQVVYMRLIEGRSREEVAQAIQRSSVTVNRLIHSGLCILRRHLRHANRFFSDSKSSADHALGADPPANGSDV